MAKETELVEVEVAREGEPRGVYDRIYYRYAGRSGWVRQAGCDSNMGSSRPRAGSLDKLEVCVSICRSQPGGVTVAGSERAAELWRAQ